MIKMHNTPPWVDSIRANFDYIAKKLLPSSSASDNGKVLTVVDGEWKAAPPSGGGGLTLYGPYILTNSVSETIASTSGANIYLDKCLDDDDNEYALPTDEKVYFLMQGYSVQNSSLNLKSVVLPFYYEEGGEIGIEDGYMYLYNPRESSVNIDPEGGKLFVYTTKELPLAE